MSFAIRLTIPSNTTKPNAMYKSIALPPCILDEIALVFPSGCAELVGVWFEYQSMKILPVNLDEDYRGNGFVIPIKPHLAVLEEDYTIRLYAYNIDDTYDHTISAYINITIQVIPTFGFMETININELVPGLLER